MVKEKGVFTIQEAIKKVTSVPAKKIFGLKARGIIKKGFYADILLFDFSKLKANEDYKNPAKTPEGIQYVLINGKTVCHQGAYTGEKSGKVLKN